MTRTPPHRSSRTPSPDAPLPLDWTFYRQDAATVARQLIGAILVRRYRNRTLMARIVETEAYVGAHDLACHASRGRTRRTRTMFLPGGYAYIYFIYGMYDMFNVVTGSADDPQAVLLRAAEPLGGWAGSRDLAGPGKLTGALHITCALDAADLTAPGLHILPRPDTDRPAIGISPRIGVDYARHWKDAPLRFFDTASVAISRPWRATT